METTGIVNDIVDEIVTCGRVFCPPNPLTVKYSSITVSQLLPGIPVELTNYGDSYNIAPIFGIFAGNINYTTHTPHDL